jgi:serine-type D-Ala-D-Ala carboxypeptidase/endopeptidase
MEVSGQLSSDGRSLAVSAPGKISAKGLWCNRWLRYMLSSPMRRLSFALFVSSMLSLTLGTAQVSAPSAAGLWLGTLNAGSAKLRIQFHLDPATGACSLDSIDQGAKDIPCSALKVSGAEVSFAVPVIQGKFHGTLAPDGKTLNGTWSQGVDMQVTLTRESQPVAVEAPKPPKMDAALPPVKLDGLKAVLDGDLADSVHSGLLSPAQHGGVVIGVEQGGKHLILTYGEGRADGLYEIGSITKTFTGLILAQMVEQHQVGLDTPVRELLPAGTVAKPATGRELTLLDLSRQHSGLPRMPDNFSPSDPANPYADYDAKKLYAFMGKQGVSVAPDAPFVYSNLGVGLLGQALANRAGVRYPQLLHDQVTGPLGMKDTVIAMPSALQSRFVQGYDGEHHPAHAWDLDALAGAGGIRSTADDMLTYLEAQLHPDRLPASTTSGANGRTLPAAIQASHVLHGEVGQGMHIALNWFQIDKDGSYWHNGGTGGFSSYARFNPGKDYAIVVLVNTAPNGFSDMLGAHIAQRLDGDPAISIENQK